MEMNTPPPAMGEEERRLREAHDRHGKHGLIMVGVRVADLAWALSRLAEAREAQEDAQPFKDALHDLVMLKAQQDIGCVPAPSNQQWGKAWAEAEELVRVEP